MRPGELMTAAADALNRGLESFAVVLNRRCSGRRRMVVFPKPRLYGEVACENADGRTVVYVNALDVLAWLAATDLVTVKLPDGEALK